MTNQSNSPTSLMPKSWNLGLEETLKKLIEQTVLVIPKIATGLAVFFLFWLLSAFFQKIIRNLYQKSDFRKDILSLAEHTVRFALLTFGAVTALGTAGINVSALVAGLGLTGFALGFAFRDMLSNLLAGIFIIIFHPFQPGDHISVAGLEGKVTEIDLRYTTLKSGDKRILMPNSTLLTNAIIVYH